MRMLTQHTIASPLFFSPLYLRLQFIVAPGKKIPAQTVDKGFSF
jgi:hypothetical protein